VFIFKVCAGRVNARHEGKVMKLEKSLIAVMIVILAALLTVSAMT